MKILDGVAYENSPLFLEIVQNSNQIGFGALLDWLLTKESEQI